MSDKNLWGNYTTKETTPVDNDELMIYDSEEKNNKKLLFGVFWKWIAKKLKEAELADLETNNKTVVGAINYLYGKSQTLDFIECRVKTVSGTVKITKETIISGTAPSLSSYIPIIIGHKSTNNVVDYVFYDSPNWIVKSDAQQEITIRFYKTAK